MLCKHVPLPHCYAAWLIHVCDSFLPSTMLDEHMVSILRSTALTGTGQTHLALVGWDKARLPALFPSALPAHTTCQLCASAFTACYATTAVHASFLPARRSLTVQCPFLPSPFPGTAPHPSPSAFTFHTYDLFYHFFIHFCHLPISPCLRHCRLSPFLVCRLLFCHVHTPYVPCDTTRLHYRCHSPQRHLLTYVPPLTTRCLYLTASSTVTLCLPGNTGATGVPVVPAGAMGGEKKGATAFRHLFCYNHHAICCLSFDALRHCCRIARAPA